MSCCFKSSLPPIALITVFFIDHIQMSIAFYPSKGLVCYGSEQASVKAGMNTAFPGAVDELGTSRGDIDADVLRLDLDDLGGEIMCLD
jgi:hypothetical protein